MAQPERASEMQAGRPGRPVAARGIAARPDAGAPAPVFKLPGDTEQGTGPCNSVGVGLYTHCSPG
jgi:hypothetical protein